MGSRWRAVLGDAPDGVIGWVGHELARLESAWSRFDPASELRRVEAAAGGRWVPISVVLGAAIDRALRLAHHTEGIFDPTVGGCLAALGYDRTFRLVPADGPDPVAPVPAAGHAAIELDPAGPALRLRRGTRLDLGGVGKGLAADLVVAGALERGAASACVGVGGDVRVGGVAPPGGWPVPLADPAGGAPRTVILHAGALVTSTTAIRHWRRGGRDLHHLVDPATGRPATTGIRAVVRGSRPRLVGRGHRQGCTHQRTRRRTPVDATQPSRRVVRRRHRRLDHGGTGMRPEVWWYAARASGLVAWVLVTASTCLGLAQSSRLLRGLAKAPWIIDVHRHLATLTVIFSAVHVGGLWADSFVTFGPLEVFVPMASGWRPGAVAWGIVAVYLLIAVQATSVLMKRMPRRVWHAIHLSSLAVFVMATIHGLQAGTDLSNVVVTWLGWSAAALLTFAVVFRLLSRTGRRRATA